MPSHADNLARVRDACVKANPEIVELKFGCEVAYEGFVGNPHIWHRATVVGKTRSGEAEVLCVGRIEYFEPDKLKVIGRPITLPDVLLALGKHDRYEFVVDTDGRVRILYVDPATPGGARLLPPDHPHGALATLDLRTGLSGWPEEAVAALANLLKPNE